MTSQKSLDPRYRINIEPGMRVMIEEENSVNSELVPCYVKEIISSDTMNELGVKVICENDKKGRVKYIGTESCFLNSRQLLIDLEQKLRKIIVEELSKIDPQWWENKIAPSIKLEIEQKLSSGKDQRKQLGVPEYELIGYTNFIHLQQIIGSNSWKYFEKIFKDKNAILVKLNELAVYRNPSAHANELTPHIEKKIQVYYDDIIYLIEDYQRKQNSNLK